MMPASMKQTGGPARRSGVTVFLTRFLHSFAKGTFWMKVTRHVLHVRILFKAYQALVRRFCPVNPRLALFATFASDCSCNPKAVAQELARRHPEVKIVWWTDHASYLRYRTGGAPGNASAVEEWSFAGIKAVMTAGILVENAQMLVKDAMPPKRPGQFVLNTWHGSLGIKRLQNAGPKFARCLPRLKATVDAVLVNSDFEDAVFDESIFLGVRRLRIGHPRNDVFFLPKERRDALRVRVMERIGLSADIHLALYAPTFRASGFYVTAGSCDFAAWAQALSDRFGGKWVVGVRLHPTDRRGMRDGLFSLPTGLLDVSEYEDMQELLVAADAGITDYSSWIFDYLLGGAPGFVYAPDRAQYAAGRGLYYPLEETPFPIAEDELTLCANIRRFDAARYAEDVERFLKRRGCYERGDAASRAVDVLESCCGLGASEGVRGERQQD